MDHRIHQLPSHTLPLQNVKKVANPAKQSDFKAVLAGVDKVKVSKHAKERIDERNISINEKDWQLITEKMAEAKRKGVTDSLVVMNNAALLVSTKNNTVVTAMNREEAASKIFTNINGTILINE
ncbi:flagellar protein [Virgibacillus dakarensis]|uniref:Flagellar protein n=1 Tax=Lentibacillus populi TaxID=1827502 RepID=A0A9W5TUP8_9BACI|nr:MULTISPECIES: TIGR02530 family flagellar biosynthesis protein [Bacillaceae]MBT2216670.1 flagellar protein [Virgibacillus dakarensis]MTW86621.1 flagellar protein [Virgibacillus dakarensis]GGB30328.1 hypothetical protein GCM10011409_04570 [Lentibacillus populi]